MKRSELIRRLAAIPPFPIPRPEVEQVATPPEIAADLLFEAVRRDDLVGRHVLDLGCGTGIFAIGAALLGAEWVTGIEVDPVALGVARAAAVAAGVTVEWRKGDVADTTVDADTVVMNPPFGAQRAHADRVFWDAALTHARRAVYGFALTESRTFIARRAVARRARIEETQPVAWRLPRTFGHHRRRAVELAVDRWVLRIGEPP
ncbi:MAG TPA: methyltransferase [Thermoplasmata archaeon]|nr:methyltransferase [Thermoplasmata archaeon]